MNTGLLDLKPIVINVCTKSALLVHKLFPKKAGKLTIQRFGADAWFLTHPGFPVNPSEYSMTFMQMSYEFATWLTGWDRGVIGKDEYHDRNFKIARRKSCYPEPLLNELGIITEAGQKVLERAKLYIAQVHSHYQSIGVTSLADIPRWDQVREMDKIVLAGLIETKHLIFLRTLYKNEYPTDSSYTHMGQELPNDIPFEFTIYEGKSYMTTNTLRNYPHRRKQFEYLVKLGLIELTPLPKSIKQLGRGRAPVGASLSGTGLRFFQDYLERYDPIRIKQRQTEQQRLQ